MAKIAKRTKVTPTKTVKSLSVSVKPGEGATIIGRAVLANVVIGMWEARRFDAQVTEETNTAHKADPNAGRYNKHLFGGPVPELSAVVTAGHYLRWAHYAQTLPWTDDGWRLLPTENYFPYIAKMREKMRAFDEAIETLIAAYPRLKREAKVKLNGMFNDEDYPTAAAIRAKYHRDMDFMPIAAGSDFRIPLPQEELARLGREQEDRLQRAVQIAMTDAWQRLGDAVTELRGWLAEGKLRGGIIDRVTELAETLGRINLTGDPALEAARKAVLANLATMDAATLKKDEKARTAATVAADAILAKMKAVYSPGKEDA